MENLQWNWIKKYLISGEYVIWNGKSGTGHSIYVITNKRIFSFRDYEIQTLDYHTKLSGKVTRHPDDFGNIRFYIPALEPDEVIGFYTTIQLAGLPSYELVSIPDVAHVLRILTETEAD